MLKSNRLILVFSAAVLIICLLFSCISFINARQLAGNNVVFIVSDLDQTERIGLDSVRRGMELLSGAAIAGGPWADSGVSRNAPLYNITYYIDAADELYVTGIYIQGRNYSSLERFLLARRFAEAAGLNPAQLRFIDLDQYVNNIFIRINVFALVIAISAFVFFSARGFFAPIYTNLKNAAVYGSLTLIFALIGIYLWNNIAAYLPPPFQPFAVRPFIDILFNRGAFEGIGTLSQNHQALLQYNNRAAYSILIGAGAFAYIAVVSVKKLAKHDNHFSEKTASFSTTLQKYTIKRLLHIIPTFVIMTMIIFHAILLMPTPGMPHFPPNAFAMYLEYILGVLNGDFGYAWTVAHGMNPIPVSELIAGSFRYTAFLAVGSIVIAGIFGVILGIIAALKQNKLTDNIIMVATLIASAIPIFFLAVLLMFIASGGERLGWLPARSTLDDLSTMVLPILTLAIPSLGFITRTTRTAMIDVLNMPHITAARARGLSERKIIFSHALSNMRIPVINSISLRLVELFVNTVIVEHAFMINGTGILLLESINNRDRVLMMGIIIVFSLVFILNNLVTDLLGIIIDPRVRRTL